LSAQLERFLLSNKKVEWMLVTAAARTGKSRLALELCYGVRHEWHAGFLSRTDKFRQWTHFRPSRPTLVVIDYVAGRSAHHTFRRLFEYCCWSVSKVPGGTDSFGRTVEQNPEN
jgi:hypothetical protein